MMIFRRIARPLLASIFVTSGVDTLRNPQPLVSVADDVAPKVAGAIPALANQDTESLVKINAGVQVVAGSLFALNRLPRLSALALAATIVPTTAAAHRYWEAEDPSDRQQQQTHFYKNVSILGGLLLASADTEGRPGVAWRARHKAGHAAGKVRHRAEHAGIAVQRTRKDVKRAAKVAKREAKLAGKAAKGALPI